MRVLKRSYERRDYERRCYERNQAEIWKGILSQIKKAAKERRLVVTDNTLTSLTIAEKNDPSKSIRLALDLMNGGQGVCTLSLDGKSWKMGDYALIRDRSLKGGTKRPDLDHQIENMLDLVEFKLRDRITY